MFCSDGFYFSRYNNEKLSLILVDNECVLKNYTLYSDIFEIKNDSWQKKTLLQV